MKEQLTNQSIRKLNTTNLLLSLIAARECTRNELADKNMVSVMTVKKIVDYLLTAGVLEEKEVLDTNLGRKPRVLQIESRFGATICVSLTSKLFFRYVIYNLYGELLSERECLIEEQYSYRSNLEMLIGRIRSDVKNTGLELIGIGISVPGAYYSEEDAVNYDLIPQLGNLHLRSIFAEAFGIDNILITHDVFISAQAEYDFREKTDSLFYFYVGDGVGGAFIEHGKWYAGRNKVAGEVGQCLLETDQGEQTLEESTSVPALLNRLSALYPEKSFYQLLRMYDEQVPEIVEVIDQAAGYAARSLYNVSWVLNPDCIVIGSSYCRYAEIIAVACQKYCSRLKDLPIRMEMEILTSKLPKHGEMLGCFKLLRNSWVESI